MKILHFFILTITSIFLFNVCNTACLAAQTKDIKTTVIQKEIYEDGSYILDELTIYEPRNIDTYSTYSTKSATRTYTYYNSNKKKAWSFSVTGKFKYNGSTSSAIHSSVKEQIFINGWKCADKFATYSLATAKGSGTFKYLTLSKKIVIGIKCSASGVISNVNY